MPFVYLHYGFRRGCARFIYQESYTMFCQKYEIMCSRTIKLETLDDLPLSKDGHYGTLISALTYYDIAASSTFIITW